MSSPESSSESSSLRSDSESSPSPSASSAASSPTQPSSSDTTKPTKRQLANKRRKLARKKQLLEAELSGATPTRQIKHLKSKARQASHKACKQFTAGIDLAREAHNIDKALKASSFASSSAEQNFKNSIPARVDSRSMLDKASLSATKALQLSHASKLVCSSSLAPRPAPPDGIDHIHKRLFR